MTKRERYYLLRKRFYRKLIKPMRRVFINPDEPISYYMPSVEKEELSQKISDYLLNKISLEELVK